MIELPKLPYELNALEPYLTKQVIDLHYNKHHKSYVNNLNKLIKDTTNENKSLEQIVKSEIGGPVFNNAAQTWNHTFYWNSMVAHDKSKFDEKSEIGKAIIKEYESFDKFKKEFTGKATKFFGSGWVWLTAFDEDKSKLDITSTRDADTPMAKPHSVPLLCIDIWEHAYLYQDTYFADRAAYVDAWWNIVNWDFVNTNFKKAK